MGSLAGNRGFRLRKTSRQLESTQAASSSTAHHLHLHRERRFHRPRQALGLGYYAYDVRLSAPAAPGLASTATAPEPEPLSEREILHLVARSGLRIMASVFGFVMFCFCLKWLLWAFARAAHAWL